MGKVLDIPAMMEAMNAARSQGRTTVLCHGAFDIPHAGHVRHLEEAKTFGDILVVGVTPANVVAAHKGDDRPRIDDDDRLFHLAALACVDYVFLDTFGVGHGPDAIRALKPDIFCKGIDYAAVGLPPVLAEAAAEVGAAVRFTSSPKDSTSRILRPDAATYPDATLAWLEGFRGRHTTGEVLEAVRGLEKLRVLVMSDSTDVDESEHIVEELQGSPDEDFPAVRIMEKSDVPGVANVLQGHLSTFVAHTEALTQRQTVRTEGFLARCGDRLRQVFATTEGPNELLTEGEEDEIIERLEQLLPEVDVCLVADYGRGLFTPIIRHIIEKRAPFLAGTVKSYFGNYPNNPATKWNHMDLLVLNHAEVELALSQPNPSDRAWLDCMYVIETEGERGLNLTDPRQRGKPRACPSLALDIADPLGSGDAILSIAGPLLATGTDPEVVAFLSSCAAALHCQVVQNSRFLDRYALLKFAMGLMLTPEADAPKRKP